MKNVICLIFCLFNFYICSSQVFRIGESISYDLIYNYQFIWLKAGTVDIQIDEKLINNDKYYYFNVIGKTYPFFEYFYKVDYMFNSIVSKDFKLYSSERKTIDNDNVVIEQYKVLDKIYCYQSYNKINKLDTLEKLNILDPIGISFYLRTLDFSKYNKNQKINIKVLTNNRIIETYIRYIVVEDIIHNDKKYNCIKISVNTIKGTLFSGGETLYIWLLNDKTHTPIYIESKIRVGSIKAYIK